jgi:hypothetical protein
LVAGSWQTIDQVMRSFSPVVPERMLRGGGSRC